MISNIFPNNPYMLLIFPAILLLYAVLSRRTRLPRVPLMFFILYFLFKWVIIAGYIPNEFITKAKLVPGALLGFAVIRVVVAIAERLFKFAFSKVTRDALLILSYVIWTLIILRLEGGINPVSFLTTSAILTLVMGLSLQNTFGNFFAGLSLQMERPYKIGDWIECEHVEGNVVEIGWKSTRIVTKEHELAIIPNLTVTKEIIKNMSKPDPIHVAKFKVGVDYDAPPDEVKQTLFESVLGIEGILANPKPIIWLTEFGDFAIEYTVRFAHKAYHMEWSLLSEARRRCWYGLKRKGFRIPFPIRDVRPWSEMRAEEAKERQTLAKRCEEVIINNPLFTSLSVEERSQLAKNSRTLMFATNEDMVRQNEDGKTMYMLSSGTADIIANGTKVAEIGSGTFFGEMSLLTGEKRTATVRANSLVEAIEISKDDIAPIIQGHPQISEELAMALAKRQAELDEAKKTDVKGNASKLVAKIKSFFGIK